MNPTFISSSCFKYFFLVLFGFLLISYNLFLLGLIIFAIALVLFRRVENDINDQAASYVLSAPVNGTVVDVVNKENETQILIKRPWFAIFGIAFPVNSKVISVDDFSEYSEESWKKKLQSHKVISLKMQRGQSVFGLDILYKSFRPSIWVQTGDLGKSGAYLGMSFFSSYFILKVPNVSTLAIVKNDKLKRYKSVILSFGDEDESENR